MPLTWNVSKVENYKVVTTAPWSRGTTKEKWHPVTNAIVMLSMVCGYREVTEKNYKTVAKRLAAYQSIDGAYMAAQDWPDIFITEEDVKMHIGLSVNVTPISDAQWAKKLVDMVERNSASILDGSRNTRKGPLADIADAKTLSAYEVNERIAKRMKADEA